MPRRARCASAAHPIGQAPLVDFACVGCHILLSLTDCFSTPHFFLACTISFTCTRICLRLLASCAGSVKIVFPRFDAVLQHISTAQLLTPSRHPPSPAHHADLLLLSLASVIASLQSQEGVLMLTATHIIFVEPKTNAETMVRHICDPLSSPRHNCTRHTICTHTTYCTCIHIHNICK